MVEHNQSQYYGNQYKFNGKELDVATGMYYYGARYDVYAELVEVIQD